MANKRAQIFSLYIVVFLLFLCGVSIMVYIDQQEDIQAFVISPKYVLDTRTNLSVFELREMELISDSLNSAEGDFESEVFLSSFRDNFIFGVAANQDMDNFLLDNLFIGGVEVRETDKGRNLLADGIYIESLTFFDEGVLNFGRGEIGKRAFLNASNKNKDFPVFFNFEFERKYLITNNSGKFEVVKV